MFIKRIVIVAAIAMLAPSAAFAAHGKAGLWSSVTTVAIPGMAAQSHSATYCMTPAQVNSDAPPGGNPSCSYQNVQVTGQTFNADMVCRGTFNATGHFTSTYDSDSHYNATITLVTGETKMTNTIEGRWVKADCAGAQH